MELYCIVVFQVRTNNTIMYFNKSDHPPQFPKDNSEVGGKDQFVFGDLKTNSPTQSVLLVALVTSCK